MTCVVSTMTKAQRKWLLRALPPHSTNGCIQNYDYSAFGKSNYERMTAKLAALGLLTATAHGDYRITDAGRRVASCWIGDRAFAGAG